MHAHLFRGALRAATAVVLGSTLTGGVCAAASSATLLGSLIGSVHDNSGIPQMGAVVQLFNGQEKLIEKVVTSADGGFRFPALTPDLYSIRVSLSSFVPALRRNISVQPGMQSVLAINMATLLSSVELVYTSRSPGTLMSDDWKWVLRSSMTTRPVTRILPGIDISDPTRPRSVVAVFSDTRGMVKLSSGETTNPFAAAGNQPDLGTSFALATSLFGDNYLQFSGNLGYGMSADGAAAGFRTSFSRAGFGPEVKLTLRQVGLTPAHGGLLGQSSGNAPALRTLSVTMLERAEITDGLSLDYGASLDSVTYLDRLNYISPFARLRSRIGGGTLDIGYSSGSPPVELLNGHDEDGSLQNDLAALSVLPRVSIRNGRAQVQRTENMEIGYRLTLGSRTWSVGAYHEFVRNGALTMSSSDVYFPAEMLPELSSSSYLFNIGNYGRTGFTASVTQTLGERFSATIAAGRGGVLTSNGVPMESADPDSLRSMITHAQRHWARGILAGTLPVAGTRFITSYEWSDATTLTPGHVYLTQKIYPETGLNVRLHQPLPGWSGLLPGRLEATAELRNLLAQGYLPIATGDGRRILLTHYPRAIRGGLSFIF